MLQSLSGYDIQKGMKKHQNNLALESLRNLIAKCASQQEAADKLKITPQYLSDILGNRRGISDNIAKRLGLKKIITYEVING